MLQDGLPWYLQCWEKTTCEAQSAYFNSQPPISYQYLRLLMPLSSCRIMILPSFHMPKNNTRQLKRIVTSFRRGPDGSFQPNTSSSPDMLTPIPNHSEFTFLRELRYAPEIEMAWPGNMEHTPLHLCRTFSTFPTPPRRLPLKLHLGAPTGYCPKGNVRAGNARPQGRPALGVITKPFALGGAACAVSFRQQDPLPR